MRRTRSPPPPSVDGDPADAKEAFGFDDGDHDGIIAVGCDSLRRSVSGDAAGDAQRLHPAFGERQAGAGAATLRGQYQRDRGVALPTMAVGWGLQQESGDSCGDCGPARLQSRGPPTYALLRSGSELARRYMNGNSPSISLSSGAVASRCEGISSSTGSGHSIATSGSL